MCDPVIGATLAISAASAVTGFLGQQNAEIANRRSAQAAFASQSNGITQRQAQEQDAAATQNFDTALEARAARATAENQADQSGVSGHSIEDLLNDFTARGARYADRVNQQTGWNVAALQDQRRGAYATMQERIASVQKPSFIDAGLRIAQAGVNAYSDLSKAGKT